MINFFSVFDIV